MQERSDAVYELLRIPDKIAIDGQLRDVQETRCVIKLARSMLHAAADMRLSLLGCFVLQDLGRVPRKQRRIRQPHRDFEKLMYQALEAHKIMKQMLCDSSKRDHNEVARSGAGC